MTVVVVEVLFTAGALAGTLPAGRIARAQLDAARLDLTQRERLSSRELLAHQRRDLRIGGLAQQRLQRVAVSTSPERAASDVEDCASTQGAKRNRWCSRTRPHWQQYVVLAGSPVQLATGFCTPIRERPLCQRPRRSYPFPLNVVPEGWELATRSGERGRVP